MAAQEVEDYLEKFSVTMVAFRNKNTKFFNANVFHLEQPKVRGHAQNLNIKPLPSNMEHVFYWPFNDEIVYEMTLNRKGPKQLTIKDFTEFPASLVRLNLRGVKIESLKGIERLTKLNALDFADTHLSAQTEITGGLLRLLKLPKFQTLTTSGSLRSELSAALVMIHRHLQDRDILGCQNMMIDNGMEAYAKL